MEAHDGQYSDISWQGQAVELEDIERELNRLWHDTVAAAEGRQIPVRTSVLNLVIYVHDDTSIGEDLNETVGRLLRRHPLRAIILDAKPDSQESSLNTRINAYCYVDPNTKSQVCCEQVLVDALGEPAKHVSSIVLPLLLPDLPVHLWQIGKPDFGSETFGELSAAADKIIIDSSTFAATPDTFHKSLTVSRRRKQRTVVTDLNWIRLYPWFETVASFFDNPELLPHLYSIKEVTIDFVANDEGRDHRSAQAAMMAGWLFSRLGEEPSKVSLVPVKQGEMHDGDIASFCLETEHDGEAAKFCVNRLENQLTNARAWGQVERDTVLDQTVSLPCSSVSDMLDTALESSNRDKYYEEALKIASQILTEENA